MEDILNKHGVFYAFSNKQYNKQAKEGVEYVSVFGAGDFVPKDNVKALIEDLKNYQKKEEKKEKEITGAIGEAIKILRKVSDEINDAERYQCGISGTFTTYQTTDGRKCAKAFFESPNYQNATLFYRLKDHGFSHGQMQEPYNWVLTNPQKGIRIRFCEGDLMVVPTSN